MPKGTCWAEATPNSEKIKLVALAVVELTLVLKAGRQAGGRAGRQAGGQAGRQLVSK